MTRIDRAACAASRMAMRRDRATACVLAAALSCATAASAEVTAVGASGFQVVQKTHVAGTAGAESKTP